MYVDHGFARSDLNHRSWIICRFGFWIWIMLGDSVYFLECPLFSIELPHFEKKNPYGSDNLWIDMVSICFKFRRNSSFCGSFFFENKGHSTVYLTYRHSGIHVNSIIWIKSMFGIGSTIVGHYRTQTIHCSKVLNSAIL